MSGVPVKLQTAVTLLLGLESLLAVLHCDSLELLSLKVRLQGNIIKMSFAASMDHTVFSLLRTGNLPVRVAARSTS